MSKLNFYVLTLLGVFILLNLTSQVIQALVLGFMSVLVVLAWMKNNKINKYAAYFFLVLFFVLVLTMTKYKSVSIYNMVSEMKILVIFALPVFFHFILRRINSKKFIVNFFKLLSVMVLMLTGYGFVRYGLLRYTGFLDHSIYLAVGLTLLMSFLYYDIKNIWKLITLINIAMLGSSSGVVLYILVIILKLPISTWKKIVPFALGTAIAYWYIVDVRGREILNGGIWGIDRVQIIVSTAYYAFRNFNFINYLIGFGIGVPLKGFSFNNPWIPFTIVGFKNWFMNFTSHGVFPYAFHNEFLRLFYDFGILGMTPIILFLKKNLDKTTFIALVIACMTNTIIFSTVGLVIISLIISARRIDNEEAISPISESLKTERLISIVPKKI